MNSLIKLVCLVAALMISAPLFAQPTVVTTELAGTGAVATVEGNDRLFTVDLIIGANPAPEIDHPIYVVTFEHPFRTAPKGTFSPTSFAAALDNNIAGFYMVTTPTTMTFYTLGGYPLNGMNTVFFQGQELRFDFDLDSPRR